MDLSGDASQVAAAKPKRHCTTAEQLRTNTVDIFRALAEDDMDSIRDHFATTIKADFRFGDKAIGRDEHLAQLSARRKLFPSWSVLLHNITVDVHEHEEKATVWISVNVLSGPRAGQVDLTSEAVMFTRWRRFRGRREAESRWRIVWQELIRGPHLSFEGHGQEPVLGFGPLVQAMLKARGSHGSLSM
jgi:hypothetical protein